MEYKRGDRVEVIDSEEGFEGSYYGAVIVTKLNGDEYIVTYDTLLKEDLSGPLREVVEADNLRPKPPPPEGDQPTRYRLYQSVDVFHNDGWWVGRIIGKIGSVYNVFFDSTQEELPYGVEALRIHQDWVDGTWVTPAVKKLEIKS
ncbi:OLC1v1023751C1 [Oldenlandia corymbosa var. corymbosa]|uniref:OLC1v1023751C1 n=1 Tax=Oldenlandia corymbosa var. corymbosa TaxID=529605 RepID=A0AAV1C3P8_OLDCO|nr:OLC1v1023751C1 [Oldenlandia corymbosa var. corymbosa]